MKKSVQAVLAALAVISVAAFVYAVILLKDEICTMYRTTKTAAVKDVAIQEGYQWKVSQYAECGSIIGLWYVSTAPEDRQGTIRVRLNDGRYLLLTGVTRCETVKIK